MCVSLSLQARSLQLADVWYRLLCLEVWVGTKAVMSLVNSPGVTDQAVFVFVYLTTLDNYLGYN